MLRIVNYSVREQADIIFKYILGNGPTTIGSLLKQTSTSRKGFSYSREVYGLQTFPENKMRRSSHGLGYFVGDLSIFENKIAYRPGDWLSVYELAKKFMPNPDRFSNGLKGRRSMSYFINYRFPPQLSTLFRSYYGFKITRENLPLEQILNYQLVLNRNSETLIRKIERKPKVIVTAKANGLPIAKTLSSKLGNLPIAVFEKKRIGDENELFLNPKTSKFVRNRDAYIVDDYIDTKFTVQTMKEVIEDKKANIIGIGSEIIRSDHVGLGDFDFVCSMPSFSI